MENSVTLQTIFFRVLKTKIRTKNETRKTQKQVGFLDLVLFVGPSVEPQPAASAGRATPASGFWYAPAAGKSGEVRWLPSAKLGGRQAAGVLFLGARLAWALAMRIKNALRSLDTLRRTRGYLREGNI